LPFFRLPSSRLNPFEHTAIDVAGDYKIVVDKEIEKRWMLVMQCATIRAVHIKMLETLTTESFLMAVERFLAVRPRPSVFLADNRTNFHGDHSVLEKLNKIDINEAQRKLYRVEICPV
jgi:hypothetical protein